jgi:tetratricopeptide (TPR) repeat protein
MSEFINLSRAYRVLRFCIVFADRREAMSMPVKSITMLTAAVFLIVAGCSKKAAPPTSIMDTPAYHYRIGLTYLEHDRIDDATKSFDRAITLDPRSSLGYIGIGLAYGQKGEFKPAFEHMSKAKYLDPGIEANIGMIRLLSIQRAKNWISHAEDEFKTAQKKDPNSARLHYFMGMAYKADLDFDKAAAMYKIVLDLNKEFIGEADAECALIRKIQRAAPVTEIGKKIALIDKIDRADIAALFDKEMNLDKIFAKPSIDLVLKLRIRGLEAGPDFTFEPNKLITRGEFAIMLDDILIKITGDEKLATKFLGATSPFPDVKNDQYFFSAAMLAVARGFIEADKATGEFRPGDPVSGADALCAIRELKNQLKI